MPVSDAPGKDAPAPEAPPRPSFASPHAVSTWKRRCLQGVLALERELEREPRRSGPDSSVRIAPSVLPTPRLSPAQAAARRPLAFQAEEALEYPLLIGRDSLACVLHDFRTRPSASPSETVTSAGVCRSAFSSKIRPIWSVLCSSAWTIGSPSIETESGCPDNSAAASNSFFSDSAAERERSGGQIELARIQSREIEQSSRELVQTLDLPPHRLEEFASRFVHLLLGQQLQ